MFGLMRAKKCGMTDAEKHFRRMSYCGTCKTIGSLYGQKSRLLLNHDTVFLAELLSALGGENVRDWQRSYQSFNCLNLPKGEMPAALQFAAATNIILTEFKLADHSADEGKRRYKLAKNAFSKEFCKAENTLKSWDFPLDDVKAILDSQNWRESETVAKTPDEILENVSAPTAQTTAIFFREGVKRIGREDRQDPAYSLGFSFGKLIYLLDAFEDYEKDFRRRQFNAFQTAFELNDAKLSAATKRKIIAILHEIEADIIKKIDEFPIDGNLKTLFISRLSQNLRQKLKTALPVLQEKKKVCAPQSYQTKWRSASEKARNLARPFRWQMPLVFLFVFVFALVAPAQTREAKSARECFDLSFNLMFLGAIFGAVLSAPKAVLYEETKEERRKRWCDWCDCDCDCCCCCCDGCDGCCGDGCCCDCNCD